MFYRTDMAAELHEQLGTKAEGLDGLSCEESEEEFGIRITRVNVQTKAAAEAIGKPIGHYVTVDAPDIYERELAYADELIAVLGREIAALVGPRGKKAPALVVGLGNRALTPDSLGPRCVDGILVTRHLLELMPEKVDERIRPVCAMVPGVLGVTGIETEETVRGLVKKTGADLVIAVDALACRRSERICTSFQIADTGIAPGGGIGNHRKALNQETMGAPVIAVGVPMVVFASTIVADVLSELSGEEALESRIEEGVAKQYGGELIVSPKDVDVLVRDAADITAMGINLALHDGITLREIREVVH
ncbi:MAG: GPR endopeptidase [Eubacteriales bacterium]|nr:GPR endopeptidase [Eubacteriales bacterium]